MESWLQRLFLSAALLLSLPSLAEENTKVGNDSATLDAVIKPDLERRKIDESKIDSENFEIGISSGVMSTEDFGNNSSLSAFLAYYVSEDWFLEATYGSSQTSKSSAEWLGGIDLLTEDERELTYLDFSLGLNILPGEIYLGSNHAFNANMYVLAGAGSTTFGGDEYFTVNYGFGARIFATDWLAIRVSANNRLSTHNILGVDKTIQNLEQSIGLSLFF